jgi:hypothetical protein
LKPDQTGNMLIYKKSGTLIFLRVPPSHQRSVAPETNIRESPTQVLPPGVAGGGERQKN